MTSINNQVQYQRRMCQSTDYKFDAVKDYLFKDCEFLDFGSGFNPEFIKKIENTSTKYTASDENKYIINKLIDDDVDIDWIPDSPYEKKYDVIFMSSVLHEILSFKSVPEIIHTFEDIYRALKPGGHLIVRDWHNPNVGEIEWYENHSSFIKLNKTCEIEACAKALYENAITKVQLHIFNEGFLYPVGTLCGYESDIFELMFHVIWGENSLARESEERYNTSGAVEKYLLRRHDDLKLVETKEEYDESFLPHLQEYFNIEKLPCCTKLVSIYRKLTQ